MMRTKKKQKNKELPITGFNYTEDRSIFKLKDLPLLSFYCLDTKKKISSSHEIDRKAKTKHINSFK